MVIFNKYKDILKNPIDSSDLKPLNMPRLVNEKLCDIISGFKDLAIELKLDKNILNKS